jgi:large subunit ribosomal protein L17
MKHGVMQRKMGMKTDHRMLTLGNLATCLITHGRIETTLGRAKALRPFVERIITKARKGDLHNRRQVASVLHTDVSVKKLFAEVAPKYLTRNGGYTRIVKNNFRYGDCAPMAIIELV